MMDALNVPYIRRKCNTAALELTDQDACALLFSELEFSSYMREVHCNIYSKNRASRLDLMHTNELARLRSFLENAKRAAAMNYGDPDEYDPNAR